MHNQNTDIEQAVINFVIWFSGDDNLKITSDMFIVQDLGIDGIDARRFLTVFSKRFNVDISRFPDSEYFHEAINRPRFSLWRIITQGRVYAVHDLKDLQVSDLIRAAEQKILLPA